MLSGGELIRLVTHKRICLTSTDCEKPLACVEAEKGRFLPFCSAMVRVLEQYLPPVNAALSTLAGDETGF